MSFVTEHQFTPAPRERLGLADRTHTLALGGSDTGPMPSLPSSPLWLASECAPAPSAGIMVAPVGETIR